MINFAETLESYLIPAEEGFFQNLYRKHYDKKLNKAKLTVLKDKFNTMKTVTIMTNFVKASKPRLIVGSEGAEIVRKSIKTMQDADLASGITRSDTKITSHDFIIKTIDGVTVAGLPDYPNNSNGIAVMIVPVKNEKGKLYDETLLPKEIAASILNPQKG